jgi:hypothetical protein
MTKLTKITKKFLFIAATSVSLTACSLTNTKASVVSTPVSLEDITEPIVPIEEEVEIETSRNASSHNTEGELVELENPNIEPAPYWNRPFFQGIVKANKDTLVYDSPETQNRIDILKVNDSLDYTGNQIADYYEVKCGDTVGYVKVQDVELSTRPIYQDPFTKVVIVNAGASLYDDTEKIVFLRELESYDVCEVYNETDTVYEVKTSEGPAFVDKADCQVIEDNTFVVVDLSDQDLIVYSDNQVAMTSKVVTGKPSTPTNEGDFRCRADVNDAYLMGGARSKKFNGFDGGIGLHDADNWRKPDEYGGETYLTNGSHGCVNMPLEKALELDPYVEEGTRVLVKR